MSSFEQPFPDDRELPTEFTDPTALFDAYDDLPQADMSELDDMLPLTNTHAAEDFQARLTDLPRGDVAANPDPETLFYTHLRLGAWTARKSLNMPLQEPGAHVNKDQRFYSGDYINLSRLAELPMPLDDRLQATAMTILKLAVDYHADLPFAVYAKPRIEQDLKRAILAYGALSGAKIPQDVDELQIKATIAVDALTQELQTSSIPEALVADWAGEPAEAIRTVAQLKQVHDAIPLDKETSDPDKQGVTIYESIQDTAAGPEEIAENHDLIVAVHKKIETLRPRDRQIIDMIYGIGGIAPMTHSEIAEHFNVSRGFISIRHGKILKLIRQSPEASSLHSHL